MGDTRIGLCAGGGPHGAIPLASPMGLFFSSAKRVLLEQQALCWALGVQIWGGSGPAVLKSVLQGQKQADGHVVLSCSVGGGGNCHWSAHLEM